MFALVLSSLLASAPDPATEARHAIERAIVLPLASADERRFRFSRAAQPMRERSVQVTKGPARKDKDGAEFYTFVIVDKARGKQLQEMRGCAYTSGEVFVQRGGVHYPAAFLTGKTKDKADAHVCVDAAGS